MKTIESIRRLSGRNYEVIVIDDGGDDGSPEALAGMDEVRVLVNEIRQGPSCGRNRGLREARGEYVWFLDSDVILPDEHLLERMVAAFSANPCTGSLGGEIVVHEQQTDRAYGRNVRWNAHNVRVTAHADDVGPVPCDYLATCNCFTRKEYAQKLNGFDERFIFGAEDMDFGVRILELGYQNYLQHDLAVLHYHEKKGRYSDETVRYQTTRIVFARKHYGRTRILAMMMVDAVSFLIFYLLLVPKLAMMIISCREIASQNLTGGWNILMPYFSQKATPWTLARVTRK
jgi:GT2 family glycosyltransferase